MLENAGIPANFNLPGQMNALIGRSVEVVELVTILKNQKVRLLTLTGPGGSGKTRLALEVSANLAGAFADGICWINLTSIYDAELVISTIAQNLAVREKAGQDLLEGVLTHLQNREMLLVLDNFEQVLAAAPVIEKLLEGAPQLKILITSRAQLTSNSELVFQIAPLALPPADKVLAPAELEKIAAVALFTERARLVRLDFALTEENAASVAEICRKLDGLPLALELAAARIKTLSPQALLTRLSNRLKLLTGGARDWPAHQQTLRSTIEWSFDLLSPVEKNCFNQLAVFAGSWTAEAVERVYESEVPQSASEGESEADYARPGEILRNLQSKSLIYQELSAPGEARFSMLETIREFAAEQLTVSEKLERLKANHAGYYVELAEKAAEELIGPEQLNWLKRLEQEHHNFRAALGWAFACSNGGEDFPNRKNVTLSQTPLSKGEALSKENIILGLRLCQALWRFWQIRGYLKEGKRWLTTGLETVEKYLDGNELPEDLLPLRANACNSAAMLARDTGDYRSALEFLEESLKGQRQLGNKTGIAGVLNTLGSVLATQGNYQRALEIHQESLQLRQELNDNRGVAISSCSMAAIRSAQGEFLEAKTLYEQARSILEELGDLRTMAQLYNNYGEVLHSLQEYSAANTYFEKSLIVRQELGDKIGAAQTYVSLGGLNCTNGFYGSALNFFSQALKLLVETGDNRYLAICLEGLATVNYHLGTVDLAARLTGAAEALREKIGAPLEPIELLPYEDLLKEIQLKLAPEDYRAFRAEGHDLPLEQTIKIILLSGTEVNAL
ncbi:MAG TPA: tetratricopeptide repeat protein [Chloroflexia bacterium]|nr:tetratricopeptide repeat protein [Chloroflexia bacterium]